MSKNPGCLGYIGDYTTQLIGDYFIHHDIRILIKQPGFNGKYPRVFRGSIASSCVYSFIFSRLSHKDLATTGGLGGGHKNL